MVTLRVSKYLWCFNVGLERCYGRKGVASFEGLEIKRLNQEHQLNGRRDLPSRLLDVVQVSFLTVDGTNCDTPLFPICPRSVLYSIDLWMCKIYLKLRRSVYRDTYYVKKISIILKQNETLIEQYAEIFNCKT